MTATTQSPRRHTAATAPAFTAAEPCTALPSMQAIQVPFDRLFLSEGNVRANDAPTKEGIEQLAAMIAADGLLNDLQVSAESVDGVATGRFAVEAGGRRWRALGLLVRQGRLAPEAFIGCKLVQPDAARSVSLAENLGQESMHPVDEFKAFARLVEDGQTPEQTAQRFGVTVLHVQRRLRLAGVAPQLLDLYRAGDATLDHMMALAAIDDPKRQLALWKGLPAWDRSAAAIKRMVSAEEVPASDERVKIITLGRYEACGGALRRDLFSDEVFLADPGLVDLIFAEVLTEKSAEVEAEGWGWVEVLPSMSYAERQRFVEPPPKYLPETDAVRQQRTTLESELAAVLDRLDTLNGAEDTVDESTAGQIDAAEADERSLRSRLRELDTSAIDPAGYPKSELGAVVTVESGKVKVLRALMKADAARAARAATQPARAGGEHGAGQGTAEKERPDLSEALMLNLTAHRTAALQASMLGNQSVALAALAARLAEASLDFGSKTSSLQISVTTSAHRIEQNAGAFAQSAAATALAAEEARWKADLPKEKAAWFPWLLDQPQATVLALITYCTALSVDAIEGRASERHAADPLAKALDLDMAHWWAATDATYLGKVPKAKLIEAVTEACGTEAIGDLSKMKKAEAVAHAQARLDGTRWLPLVLRARG